MIRKIADIQIGIVSAPVFPILALVHEQESLFPVNLQLYFLKIFSKRNRAVLIRKVTEGFIIKAYSTLDGAFSSGKQFSNVRFFSQQGGCETQPYAIVFFATLVLRGPSKLDRVVLREVRRRSRLHRAAQ